MVSGHANASGNPSSQEETLRIGAALPRRTLQLAAFSFGAREPCSPCPPCPHVHSRTVSLVLGAWHWRRPCAGQGREQHICIFCLWSTHD